MSLVRQKVFACRCSGVSKSSPLEIEAGMVRLFTPTRKSTSRLTAHARADGKDG